MNVALISFLMIYTDNGLFFCRDFMDSNMDRTKHMLNYLYPIVGRSNPELRDFMERQVIHFIYYECPYIHEPLFIDVYMY